MQRKKEAVIALVVIAIIGLAVGITVLSFYGFHRCGKGFTKTGFHCINIDECSNESLHDCQHICHDQSPGYNCSCNPGFTSFDDGHHCQAVCSGANECGDRGECVSPGKCRCNIGYRGEETGCNEAVCSGAHECGDRGECVFPGKCQCNIGYRGEETGCNEAICSGEQACGDRGQCVLPNKCQCHSGYSGETTGCNTFICDETCEVNSHCTGPNQCTCKYGFRDVGGECIDIDECTERMSNCLNDCINTIPGYKCSSNNGYSFNENKFSFKSHVEFPSSGIVNLPSFIVIATCFLVWAFLM